MGEKTKIAVSGAAGRMGRLIAALVVNDDKCELAGALESPKSEHNGTDAGELAGVGATGIIIGPNLVTDADVLIDFTLPEACLKRLEECADAGMGAVVGTTGFSPEEKKALEGYGERMPLMVAPNMSVGVNLMFRLAKMMTSMLGEGYDIEIVESHHNRKKDAPSGTAKKIAESICEARGWDPQEVLAHGREGITGSRPEQELGMHAVRGGDIVGEHTVIFAGKGERMEITHRAGSRNVFASGAVNAAKFIRTQRTGLYGIQDMLKD